MLSREKDRILQMDEGLAALQEREYDDLRQLIRSRDEERGLRAIRRRHRLFVGSFFAVLTLSAIAGYLFERIGAGEVLAVAQMVLGL